MATVPAHAQSKGQFQIGVGAGLPFYNADLDLQDKVGFGGRLGYMFTDKIGLEGDVFYYETQPNGNSYTGPNIRQMPIHGRLTYNAPMGKGLGIIFGLGYAYNMWGISGTSDADTTDSGPGGLIGLRFGAGGPVSLRVDFTGDYILNPITEGSSGNDSRFDPAMNFTLSLGLGGKPATPKDTDKDGVPDKTDLCPDTPLGTAVDANGCPFGDADKDGVTDNLDTCPNTPMGATVDAKGCPADADGDKVLNGIDQCPNTPVGMKVNALGCPVLFEPGKSALVLEGVTFATNSSVLDPTSTGILDRLANAAQYNPAGLRLEIAGYTDNTGSRTHNMRLSQARAESVMNYLISKGVPASALTAKGYGPDFPIDTNATAAGRANNRRVMIKQVQ